MSKKITKILLICLVLMMSTRAFAAENKSSIIVSGMGTIEVRPDMANLNFSITTNNEDSKVALNDNNLATNKLIESLKKSGIKDEDIKTNYVSLRPMYDYEYVLTDDVTEIIVGYEAVNSIVVTVRDLSKVGSTLSFAVDNGATSIGYIEYKSSKGDEVYNQAIIAAIREGKVKAEAIKKEIGVQNINLTKVAETSNNYYRNNIVSLERKTEAAAIEDVPVNIENLKISASVSLEYAY